MFTFWLTAILVLISALAAGLIYLGLRRQGARLAALTSLATAKGWAFSHDPGTLGRPATQVLSGPDWTLTLTTVAGPGYTVQPLVIWQTPVGALDDGAAILGAAAPQRGIASLKALAFQYVEDLSDIAKDVKMITSAPAHPQGTLFASPGQESALNAIRDNPLLANTALQPLIIRDSAGLQLRLRDTVPTDQLAGLVALGVSLRNDLRG